MTSRWWLMLPRWLRAVPADLAAVVALVVVTLGVVFLPLVSETPVRIVLALPFVLFVPGYAFIAALFPEAGRGPVTDGAVDDDSTGPEEGGIDGLERVALSFGTSIVIVPLIGLVLNFTPWGIRLVPIMVSVGGFTLLAAAIASHRRNELPADEQFVVPYREWLAAGRTELFHPESRIDGALNVLLVVSILLAVGSVGYAVAVPKPGEAFSELYLLTGGADGELVADDYPQEFTVGEPQSLYVGVGNHEHEQVNYTVVVELQNVTFENNESQIHQQERLNTFQTTLSHNETWHQNHTVEPTLVGERLRLTYLLYKGEAPSQPTVENAYRETHLWVNVSESAEGAARRLT